MAVDKTTRSIRADLKSIGTWGRNFTTSTARAFLASGKELFKGTMPTLTATYDINKPLLDDTIKFIRNPADVLNRQVARAMETDDFKAIQRFAKDAIDDLKSGNIYDPNRDRSSMGSMIDDMMSDFGGFDMTGFDENGDWSEPTVGGMDEIAGNVAIAEAQEKNADARTVATIDAIGYSTSAITGSIAASSQNSIRMGIKQHAQVMNAMSNMMQLQASTVKTLDNSIKSQLEVARESHNQIMSKMDDMIKLMTEIRDNTTKPKENRKEYKEQDSVFGVNGELDIKKYLGTVVKNAGDKYGLSSMLGVISATASPKDLIEYVGSNPWLLVTDFIMKALVPESLRKHATATDTKLKNFIPALFDKLASRANRRNATGEVSFFDEIASIFGVKQRSRSFIDTEVENVNAQVAFTNRTAIAIEQVIPSLLSQINSSISGKPIMVYDYKKGKFETAASVVSRYTHQANDLVGGMASANNILDIAHKMKFTTTKERDDFEKYLYQYFQFKANADTKDRFINPYQSKEEFMATMPDSDRKEYYYRLITGLLKAIPNQDLMALTMDALESRAARDKRNYDINNELRENRLGAAFSGILESDLQAAIESRTKKERRGLSAEGIDKTILDRKTAAIKRGGVQATNIILNDILGTLKKGIITYSFTAGNFADNPNGNEIFKQVMKDSVKRSDYETKLLELMNRPKEYQEKRDASERDRIEREKREGKHIDFGDMIVPSTIDGLDDSGMLIGNMVAAIQSAELTDDEVDNALVRQYRRMSNTVNQTTDQMLRSTGIKSIWKTVVDITRSPFQFMETGLKYVDAFMFKILYGEDAMLSVANGATPSLMQTVTHTVEAQMNHAKEWFVKNIGNPFNKFMFDKEEGLVPKVKDVIKEKIIDPLTSPIRERFNVAKDTVKNKLFGTKDETGRYSEGVFSSTINTLTGKGTDTPIETRIGNAIDSLLYGDYANEKRKGVKIVRDRDEKGRFTRTSHKEYGGVIGNLKRGFDTVTKYLFGDDAETDPEAIKNNKDSREKFNTVKTEVKKALPVMTIGAGLGLIGSLFLPGGPILGMILGSFGGLMSGSEKFSKYLLGDFADEPLKDSNGNVYMDKDGKPIMKKRRQGNLIDKEVADGLQRFVPGVTKGMIVGSIAGGLGLLPFGITGAAATVIGAIGGMAATSDKMKEIIFGNAVDEKSGLISKEFRGKLKQHLVTTLPGVMAGKMLGGAAWSIISNLGIIPGLSLLPGGPVFSLLGAIGGGITGDMVRKFFFGEDVVEEQDVLDEEGKPTGEKKKVKVHKGGMFGSIFDSVKNKMIEPFANKINEYGKNISKWFSDQVTKPFKYASEKMKEGFGNSVDKIKESFSNIGNHIKESLNDMFQRTIGEPLGETVKKHFIEPLKKISDSIFKTIGRVIGSIISAPFKALEFIFTGKISGHEERKAERNQRRKDRRAKRRGKSYDRFKEVIDQIVARNSNRPEAVEMTDDEYFVSGATYTGPGGREEEPEDHQEKFKEAQESADATLIDAINNENARSSNESVSSEKKSFRQRFAERLENGKKRRKERAEQRAEDRIYRAYMRGMTREAADAGRSAKREKADRKRREKDGLDERAEGADTDGSKSKKLFKGKTNNQYLKELVKYNKLIYEEIRGQVNGVGWNTGYIKALLESQFGKTLSADELPEEMEGSTKRTIKKRRTIFGKARDKVIGFGRGVQDRVIGFGRGVVDRLGFFFEPIRMIFDVVGTVKDGIGAFAGVIANGVSLLGSAFKEALVTIGGFVKDVVKGLGGFVKNALSGLGTAVGDTAAFITGTIRDARDILGSLLVGTVDFVSQIAPDILSAAWQVGKGVVKTGWKGITGLAKFGAKTAAGAAGFIGKKLFGGSKEEKERKKIGTFELAGGFLDSIKDPITVIPQLGGRAVGVEFPWIKYAHGKKIMANNGFAFPVFIVGSDKDAVIRNYVMNNDEDFDVNEYKRQYNAIDAKAERSKDPADVYDDAIRNAKTKEELDAAKDAQQMNANGAIVAASNRSNDNTGNDDNGDLFSSLMSSLTGGKNTILSKLAGIFGTTALGGIIMKGLGAAKTGGLALGSTILGNLPFLAGTATAIGSGDYERVGTNIAKQTTGRLGNWVLKSATGAADILTSPAGTRAATNVGAKLIAFFRNALSKLLSNKVVVGLISKVAKNVNMGTVSEKIISQFDDVILKLGSEGAQQLLKKAHIVVMIAAAVYDVTTGFLNAANTFKINSSDLTVGMRVAAGLAKGVSGLAFGLIPVSWLANVFYDLFADKEAETALDEKQEQLKEQAAAYNNANGTNLTVEEYAEQVNGKNVGITTLFTNTGYSIAQKESGNLRYGGTVTIKGGKVYGKGPGLKAYNQRSAMYNRGGNNMALTGCGPTAFSMVASAYGKDLNPAAMSSAAYGMGMRAPDGGTNPMFFQQAAGMFGNGFGMKVGPTNGAAIKSNLDHGNPVILMGRGGPFGSHMHYMVADGTSGTGGINLIDPLTGARRSSTARQTLNNTASTIYSYGTGPSTTNDDEVSTEEAQQLLVNKMKSIQGVLKYSQDSDKQDPDKVFPDNSRYASCASTVGWAYRKVLGLTGMSASSQTQSKDKRFVDVVRLGQPGVAPGKTFDISVLQPGDIVYMKNPGSNHTEMYIGNGQDLSHGGPDNGPQLRDLDAARQKKVFAVRRYKGFTDGNLVPITNGAYSDTAPTADLADATDPLSAVTGIFGAISGVFSDASGKIDNLLGAFTGSAIGASAGASVGSESTNTNVKKSTSTGNINSEKAWTGLKSFGLSDYAIAGIMGNLQAESGIQPNNLQNSWNKKLGMTDDEYTKAVDDGSRTRDQFITTKSDGGYGLAQWTSSGRKAGLYDLAKSRNTSIADMGTQLDYLYSELEGPYKNNVLDPMKRASSVSEASKIFLQKFEAPATKDEPSTINLRASYAQNWYDMYHGKYGTGKKGDKLRFFQSYGTGDGNISALNDKIRKYNNVIASSRYETTDPVDTTTTAMKNVLTELNTTDPQVIQIMNTMVTSFTTMIQLLSEIKQNTANTTPTGGPTSGQSDSKYKNKYANLPVAEAEYPDMDTGYETGVKIIDKLTAK